MQEVDETGQSILNRIKSLKSFVKGQKKRTETRGAQHEWILAHRRLTEEETQAAYDLDRALEHLDTLQLDLNLDLDLDLENEECSTSKSTSGTSTTAGCRLSASRAIPRPPTPSPWSSVRETLAHDGARQGALRDDVCTLIESTRELVASACPPCSSSSSSTSTFTSNANTRPRPSRPTTTTALAPTRVLADPGQISAAHRELVAAQTVMRDLHQHLNHEYDLACQDTREIRPEAFEDEHDDAVRDVNLMVAWAVHRSTGNGTEAPTDTTAASRPTKNATGRTTATTTTITITDRKSVV